MQYKICTYGNLGKKRKKCYFNKIKHKKIVLGGLAKLKLKEGW